MLNHKAMIMPQPHSYDVWYRGRRVLVGESFAVADQLSMALDGNDGGVCGEVRGMARAILSGFAKVDDPHAEELERAVEELLKKEDDDADSDRVG